MYFGTLNVIILGIIVKFSRSQFCEMFPPCRTYCSLCSGCRSVFWSGPLLCAPHLRTNQHFFSNVRTTNLWEGKHGNLGEKISFFFAQKYMLNNLADCWKNIGNILRKLWSSYRGILKILKNYRKNSIGWF